VDALPISQMKRPVTRTIPKKPKFGFNLMAHLTVSRPLRGVLQQSERSQGRLAWIDIACDGRSSSDASRNPAPIPATSLAALKLQYVN
jgi:hypothetical protein